MAALSCAAALVSAAFPSSSGGTAAVQKITPRGVGQVRLGELYSTARGRHLVGKTRPGCPLAGSGARSALLSTPLTGNVDLTMTTPRRIADISVTGGATARGVGIGARVADIKRAYPKAKVDHSTDRTFGVTMVRIPKSGGGPLEFGVEVKSKKVALIGIPFIATCD
jgi:hypothetical protein